MHEKISERAAPGSVSTARTVALPRHVGVMLRMSRRQLPEATCGVAVQRGLEIPAADGVTLLADHYVPLAGGTRPTLLVRTPYGRGFPFDYVYGALFARQGFHVLIQSCRGTGGSGGELEPFRHDAADGQAVVTWLRLQDWFSGALGTVGASYMGYTQWALAADPPPELRAMVVQVGSPDFQPVLYPGGAFALEAMMAATAAALSMHRGFPALARAMARLLRHRRRAERELPLGTAYPPAFGERVAFFEEWLAHPDPADRYWAPRRAMTSAEQLPPTSLLTGWWDICLDPTLAQYRRLRAAGRDVRLVVGPWNHTSGFNKDMPVLFGEALGWLRAWLCGDRDGRPDQPVRVHVGEPGGPGQWRDLPDWPPPGTAAQAWHLQGGGTLATEPDSRMAVSSFRYDPAAPTPSVGGPSLDAAKFGSRRNGKLEARADVLTFTSAPLGEPLEVIGHVSATLQVRGSGPHFDVFARLCDVDPAGRSWNVCDGLIRLGTGSTADPDTGPGGGRWSAVTVPMSATAHRFGAGHRLRLQISGGAHPRFARNTGTGEPLATATRLAAAGIEVGHGPGIPSLLCLPAAPSSPAGAAP
jgi:uncharacterized protein